MSLHIKKLKVDHFQEVVEVKDAQRGLHAFIAIHDTTLGPALGGIRFLLYLNSEEALEDVLRLAEGMTYKSALADLRIGGGKSTVICDTSKPKSKEMLEALGEAIHYLNGRYIGAEDMNCFLEDVQTIHETTPHILGLPGESGTGDPARFTAHGVFVAIQATAQYLWKTTALKGKKILIQGVGGVGQKLLEQLFWAGADVYISDVRTSLVKELCHEYGAKAVAPNDVYSFECDIFAPCARGGILNAQTIPQLRCRAVVGAANNQLLQEEDSQLLLKRGILYAPDYVVNAGGVISVASALKAENNHPQKVLFQVDKIFERLLEIYRLAQEQNSCPEVIAHKMAKNILAMEKEKNHALV